MKMRHRTKFHRVLESGLQRLTYIETNRWVNPVDTYVMPVPARMI